MKSLEENKDDLEGLNTCAVGISVDATPAKHAWARELDIKNTALLSDFWNHGEVAKNLGLFREKDGFSERANVIIDEDQRVVFVKVYDIPEVPDMQEIIDFLKK